jgi:hypothetical protein
MTLACRLCGIRKSFERDAVMPMYGEDYNVTRLHHALVPCGVGAVMSSLRRDIWIMSGSAPRVGFLTSAA